MIKIFEDFKSPDLRRVGKYVLCTTTILRSFIKGRYYKVIKMYGDPKRAIEEFDINEFLPVECVSKIFIISEKNVKIEFYVNKDYYKNADYDIFSKNFFDFFELTDLDLIDKYNL